MSRGEVDESEEVFVADEPFGEFVEKAFGQNSFHKPALGKRSTSTDTARGKPLPEAIATILVLLSRLVADSKAPLGRSRRSHHERLTRFNLFRSCS